MANFSVAADRLGEKGHKTWYITAPRLLYHNPEGKERNFLRILRGKARECAIASSKLHIYSGL